MNGTYTSSQPKNGSGSIITHTPIWSFLNLSFVWFIVAFVLLWSRHASVIGIILTSIVFVESKLKVSYSKTKKYSAEIANVINNVCQTFFIINQSIKLIACDLLKCFVFFSLLIFPFGRLTDCFSKQNVNNTYKFDWFLQVTFKEKY
jgi:hypothetical protein